MTADNRPVGIFDSGLGGLTAAREFMRLCPNEGVVYFGDTKNAPYGDKTPSQLMRLIDANVDFLLKKDVKFIIAACGTASATAGDDYFNSLPVPAVNVLIPAAKAAASTSKNGVIGVIATAATVKSGAFEQRIRRFRRDAFVVSVGCPRLVPLIEDGAKKNEAELREALSEYLSPIIKAKADTLLLGCTHYALTDNLINEITEGGLALVDSGKEAAKAAADIIPRRDSGAQGAQFYVSSRRAAFADKAEAFLGRGVVVDLAQSNSK